MDEQKILIGLLEDGTIELNDISDANVKEVASRMKDIKIPKVNVKQHKEKCYYSIKVPEKYSYSGKRYTIYGESEEDTIKKFKKTVFKFIKERDESVLLKQITVAELVEKALKEEIRVYVKNSTYTAYYQKYSCYIKPSSFGSMRAVEVKKIDCQLYINSLCNGKLGAVTVQLVKTLINKAFKYGVDNDILLRNYMGNVKVNEVECKPNLKDDEDVVYNQEEINALCKTVVGTWEKNGKYINSPVLLILCLTGLRIGELLALKWEDIDFEKRKLMISKTYSEQTLFDDEGNNMHTKVYTITPPKRSASIRSVVLCDEAIFWLMELKRRYEQKGRSSSYILATKSGRHPKHENIQKTLKKVCELAGVEYKALHACRRAYISIALEEGIDARTVSKQVGHKHVSTTINMYNKFILSTAETIERLNKMYSFMSKEPFDSFDSLEGRETK